VFTDQWQPLIPVSATPRRPDPTSPVHPRIFLDMKASSTLATVVNTTRIPLPPPPAALAYHCRTTTYHLSFTCLDNSTDSNRHNHVHTSCSSLNIRGFHAHATRRNISTRDVYLGAIAPDPRHVKSIDRRKNCKVDARVIWFEGAGPRLY
jgi:hypothetical protein